MIKKLKMYLPDDKDEKIALYIAKYDENTINGIVNKLSILLGATYKTSSDLTSLEGFRTVIIKNPTTIIRRNTSGEVIKNIKLSGMYEGYIDEHEIIPILLQIRNFSADYSLEEYFNSQNIFSFQDLALFLEQNPEYITNPKVMHFLRLYFNCFTFIPNNKDEVNSDISPEMLNSAKVNKKILSLIKK